MQARAVFLVGFMGSGKTTVGRELARRLGWKFVDLDRHIEAREGLTVPQIFQDRGEPGFRLAETAALLDLTQSLDQSAVVALGGGAFPQKANRELLRDWPSVFLHSPVDELWRRCAQDVELRPLRKNQQQFAQLHAERLPCYRQSTLTVVTLGRDPASICGEIESALQLS